MKKYIIIAIAVTTFLEIFFVAPFISSDAVFMTKLQKEKANIFCATHGCGLIWLITPYEYVKTSIHNAIVQN